jgi:RNA polymerase sigma factor (sigma-70 family)
MFINNPLETKYRTAVWAQVCEKNYQLAVDIIRRRSGNADRAREDVQESVVRLLTLLPVPPPDELGRRKYFLTVVSHQCIDALKKQTTEVKRMLSLDKTRRDDDDDDFRPLDLVDKARGPELDALINEENEKLMMILNEQSANLTEREKQLLEMHLMGFTRLEVADAFHEDVDVIRADLNALIAKMRYRVRHMTSTNE